MNFTLATVTACSPYPTTAHACMPYALEPETLSLDANGLPCSARYGDRYASRAGALAQARHVFLGGNALPRRWAGRRQFVIVETGFGRGTNFLACWQAWRADAARPRQLHFVSVEKHPLSAPDLAWEDPPAAVSMAGTPVGPDEQAATEMRALRAALVAQWPLPLTGLHRLSFESGGVLLTLALGDARELVPQLALGADAFFLDGFAPERNPQMWQPELLRALARLARPDATLASYTVAGPVREALGASGFAIQRQPGFGTKRHMLSAQFTPRWKARRHEPPAPYAGEQRAVIVGAGLAGCASALALVRRGWHVTLLERSAGPAGGASGLPAGLLYPLLSADDNLASRLSRAAHGYALRELAASTAPADDPAGIPFWRACGVFQQAADNAEEEQLRVRALRSGWPQSFARFENAATAAGHLGMRPRHGGYWFAAGAVVDGARWCVDLLARARHAGLASGGVLDLRANCAVTSVSASTTRGWEVRDAGGQCHAAPVLVLANAHGLAQLLPLAHLPLQVLPGALTLLEAPALQGLSAALGGDGYVIPPLVGHAAVGATYETATPATGEPPPDASAANLQRLAQLLAEPPTVAVCGTFRGQRCAAQDRLPLVGAIGDEARVLVQPSDYAGAQLTDLPRQSGLYCLAALGSRGLTLAPLLGELLASQITGEPAPVEAALCAAVDPARFLLRHLRAPAAAL